MLNPMDLNGKRILVTGSSSGIGRQTAITLSQLGARIALVARRRDKLEQTMALLTGQGHGLWEADLSDIGGIEDLVRQMAADGGVFDGFVHCAGDTRTRPLNLNKYDKMLDSFGAIYFAFAELARCLMKKGRFSDGGSIVALSSVSTLSVHGRKAKVAYSSSRAALECTVRCLASELAQRKVRVNVVSAGSVETEMFLAYQNDNEGTDYMAELSKRQFMGIIQPQEVANLIAFLLSDATHTITGSTFMIDGGYLQG